MARQVFHRLGSGARQIFGPADVEVTPPSTPPPAPAASFISGHELVWGDNNAHPLLASPPYDASRADRARDDGASFLFFAASAASVV